MEKYWQVLKTVVYSVGYSLCCLWLFMYNLMYRNHFLWWQSDDLALLLTIMCWVIWGIWTIGVACIIMDGMSKIAKENNHGQ